MINKNETMHTYYCVKCLEAGAKNAQDYFCADCKDALAAMEWLGGEGFKELVGSKKKDSNESIPKDSRRS